MADCIMIPQWLVALVGVIMMFAGGWKLVALNKSYLTKSGGAVITIVSTCVLIAGCAFFIFYGIPILIGLLPCIRVVP